MRTTTTVSVLIFIFVIGISGLLLSATGAIAENIDSTPPIESSSADEIAHTNSEATDTPRDISPSDSEASSTPAETPAPRDETTDTASSVASTSIPLVSTTTAQSAQNILTSSTTARYLTCTMAYTADLYDTPSGHLDGYTIATGDSSFDSTHQVAHIVGSQSWTVCHNPQGQTFEFKIAPNTYNQLVHYDTRIQDVGNSAMIDESSAQ
jgi:cytoskeletal protein RodZ